MRRRSRSKVVCHPGDTEYGTVEKGAHRLCQFSTWLEAKGSRHSANGGVICSTSSAILAEIGCAAQAKVHSVRIRAILKIK